MRWQLLVLASLAILPQSWATEALATSAMGAMGATGAAWSPYLVGALIGVLSMLTFYFARKPIGVSTGFARLAGLAGKALAPAHTESLKYFQDRKPKVDWEVMLLAGVLLGAFVAAWSGGELTGEWLPPMWESRFGASSYGLRLLVAFIGGAIMALGARIAGGCTSGHGISGTLQLSLGSWIALFCFFIGGSAVAFLMFAL